MVVPGPDARTTSEVRQFGERHVHAQGRRLGARGADATQELVSKVRITNKIKVEVFRRGIGSNRATSVRRAVGKHNADSAATLHHHVDNFGLRLDIDSQRQRFCQHRLADRAHAAKRVAPCAAYPVEFTERVVQ